MIEEEKSKEDPFERIRTWMSEEVPDLAVEAYYQYLLELLGEAERSFIKALEKAEKYSKLEKRSKTQAKSIRAILNERDELEGRVEKALKIVLRRIEEWYEPWHKDDLSDWEELRRILKPEEEE